MISKKLQILRRFSRDIWNLRLLTKVMRFKFPFDFRRLPKHKIPKSYSFSVNYKYFFLFFFKRYKKNVQRYRKIIKPFVYRIDLVERRQKYKRWKKRFVSLRLIRFFYAFLSYKNFRQISKSAKMKSGCYEQNYLLGLECRLVNFLYRTGLAETIFRALFFIKGGFLSINGKVSTFANNSVAVFDIVTFSPQIVHSVYIDYFMRIYQFIILHPPIRCVYLSIIFLFMFLFRPPKLKDIPNRKLINIYRLSGYAKLL